MGFAIARLADDAPGVEGHGQALAGALRVPDHADAPVARVRHRGAVRPRSRRGLGDPIGLLLELRRPQRLRHGDVHGVELVVAGHLLDQWLRRPRPRRR